MRPLSSPSAAFCISIASTARTVLARAGLQNICSLKVLHGITGNQVFGECLDATARSQNNYFLVAEHLCPLHPGGRTCVPQVNIKIVSTTFRRPSALHRIALTDTMSSYGNGAPGACGTGPALGYILNLFYIFCSDNITRLCHEIDNNIWN